MAESILWLGSQDTFAAVRAAESKEPTELIAASEYDEFVYRQLVTVQGNVGMLNINGPLLTGNAGYALHFGMTGYGDIRSAALRLASDPEVSSILLVVSSGGGAVGGVNDAVSLLRRIGNVKPLVTYTDSAMASAALWLGSVAQHVMVSPTAVVGSLGVLQVHMEYSKQLENDGVKVTVIRAGDKKALANRYEPLTEEATAQLQRQADHLYDVFLTSVAESRGMSKQSAEKKFGQGLEFVGEQAKAAGLVDSVGTLEDAYAKAQALANKGRKGKARLSATNSKNIQAVSDGSFAATSDNPANSERNTTMGLNVLTPELLAAAEAGIDLDKQDDDETAVASTKEPTSAEGETADKVEAQADPAPLQAELETVKQELATAVAQIEQMKAEAETVATQFEAALEVVRNSTRTMGLHFGVKKEAVAAMSATEVLAEHSRLAEQFKIKFKVGAVAATDASAPAEAPKPAADARLMAYAAKLTSGKR